MSLQTKTFSRKPKDIHKVVLIITIILSLIIGVVAGIEFGDVPYHAFHDDVIPQSWLNGGLAAAVTMVIGGIISGLLRSKETNEEIFA